MGVGARRSGDDMRSKLFSKGSTHGRRAVAVAVAVALLAACGGSDSTEESGGGGTDTTAAGGGDGGGGDGGGAAGGDRDVVILRDSDLSTLDPHRMWCDTCMIVLSGTYERLVNVDPADPNQLLPGLAESWESNADSTEFTFKLNPAATFADGSPVTSADVKWSYERSANMMAGGSFMLSGLVRVDTPDPQTAVVVFERPNSPFFKVAGAALALSIANSKMLSTEAGATSGPGSDADPADEWFAQGKSAGSGPYVIESFSPDQEIVLARNENYWGTKAPFASITIKDTPEAAAQVLQMRSGDADLAMNVSFDALGELDGAEGVSSAALDSFNFIHLNLNQYAPGGEPFADPLVRQAVRHAIDYEALIDATLAGNGRVQATAIPNGFPGTEDLPLPTHDPEKAKELLAEAGLADGFSIEAMYFQANIYGVDFDTMWQRIQQDLGEVGIDVQLKPVDGPQWVDAMSTTGIPFTTTFFAPDYIDASGYIQYFGPVTGSNRGFGVPVPGATYAVNDEADALLQEGLSQPDAERAQTWAKIGQIMVDDAEVVPVVNPKTLFVFRDDLPVTRLSPCCVLDLSRLGTS